MALLGKTFYETVSVTTASTPLTTTTPQTAGVKPCAAVVRVGDYGPVRYRTDGTAPTSTTGQLAQSGSVIVLPDRNSLTLFRAIRDTGSANSVTLGVEYGEGWVAETSDLRPDSNISYGTTLLNGSVIAQNAATSSAAFYDNAYCSGVIIYVRVTSVANAPTAFYVRLQGLDQPGGGQYFTVAEIDLGAVAAGNYVATFYPGASSPTAPTTSKAVSVPLPKLFRVLFQCDGAANSTATVVVGMHLIR